MCKSSKRFIGSLSRSEIEKYQIKVSKLQSCLNRARLLPNSDMNLIFRLTEELEYIQDQIYT